MQPRPVPRNLPRCHSGRLSTPQRPLPAGCSHRSSRIKEEGEGARQFFNKITSATPAESTLLGAPGPASSAPQPGLGRTSALPCLGRFSVTEKLRSRIGSVEMNISIGVSPARRQFHPIPEPTQQMCSPSQDDSRHQRTLTKRRVTRKSRSSISPRVLAIKGKGREGRFDSQGDTFHHEYRSAPPIDQPREGFFRPGRHHGSEKTTLTGLQLPGTVRSDSSE